MRLLDRVLPWRRVRAELTEALTRVAEAVEGLNVEPGWRSLLDAAEPGLLTPDQRLRVLREARTAWQRNPLVAGAAALIRAFTIGQGITWSTNDEDTTAVLREHWEDEANRWPERLWQISDDLTIDGEVFCRVFADDRTGRVVVRNLPAWQITDVITESDDAETPLFYRREWTELRWDARSQNYDTIPHAGYDAEMIPADEVIHVKVNAPLHAKFGLSPLYPVLPWVAAYKEWLEDRAKINKARSAFAWHKRIKGAGVAQITAASSGVKEALNKITGAAQMPQPPKAGSVIVSNDLVEWDVISPQIGADDAAEDGRALKLMVCAGLGIFEHYFGDAKVANLASAKAMELPMRRLFEMRQQVIEQLLRRVFRRVLRAAVAAGRLSEEAERVVRIDIDFPPLAIHDIDVLTKSLQIQVQEGWISKQTAALAVGVEDWEREQALIDQEREEARQRDRQQQAQDWPPFTPAPGPAGGADDAP